VARGPRVTALCPVPAVPRQVRLSATAGRRKASSGLAHDLRVLLRHRPPVSRPRRGKAAPGSHSLPSGQRLQCGFRVRTAGTDCSHTASTRHELPVGEPGGLWFKRTSSCRGVPLHAQASGEGGCEVNSGHEDHATPGGVAGRRAARGPAAPDGLTAEVTRLWTDSRRNARSMLVWGSVAGVAGTRLSQPSDRRPEPAGGWWARGRRCRGGETA
jgi:hypothetical protein